MDAGEKQKVNSLLMVNTRIWRPNYFRVRYCLTKNKLIAYDIQHLVNFENDLNAQNINK